jgi:WhiB family redox-sensing transcriptional regulator
MKRLYSYTHTQLSSNKELEMNTFAERSEALRPIADEWDWQYQGSCRGMDPEMFFHPDGERGPRRRNRENAAKAVCASCPVLQKCREQALAVAEPYGIWGGLSEDDRVAILSRRGVSRIYEAS